MAAEETDSVHALPPVCSSTTCSMNNNKQINNIFCLCLQFWSFPKVYFLNVQSNKLVYLNTKNWCSLYLVKYVQQNSVTFVYVIVIQENLKEMVTLIMY